MGTLGATVLEQGSIPCASTRFLLFAHNTRMNRIRALTVAFACLASCYVFAQDLTQTHGKKDSEILAMGYDKWYKFYTGKEGESTAGMCLATTLYAESMARRNDNLMRKASTGSKAQLLSLRSLLNKFGETMTNCGYAHSGGGTIWNLSYANVPYNTETVLWGMLGGGVPKAKAMKVSDARNALAKTKAMMSKKSEFDGRDEDWKMLQDNLKSADSLMNQTISIASKTPRSHSDLILSFLQNWGDMSKRM